MLLLAQMVIGTWAKYGIIAAGIIAIALIILRVFKIEIPSWFIQIGWILVAVVLGVIAINFLMSMV